MEKHFGMINVDDCVFSLHHAVYKLNSYKKFILYDVDT